MWISLFVEVVQQSSFKQIILSFNVFVLKKKSSKQSHSNILELRSLNSNFYVLENSILEKGENITNKKSKYKKNEGRKKYLKKRRINEWILMGDNYNCDTRTKIHLISCLSHFKHFSLFLLHDIFLYESPFLLKLLKLKKNLN